MLRRAVRIVVTTATLSFTSHGSAQPTPLFLHEAGWPTLAQNANIAPSCVFWTPPGRSPLYTCAVIVANPALDPDRSWLCPTQAPRCAAGALKAVNVDPNAGAVTVGPPDNNRQAVILQSNPSLVTCVPTVDAFGTPNIQCLLQDDSNFLSRVVWDGTSWSNPSPIENGKDGAGNNAAFLFVSKLSCVPWTGSSAHPRSVTCFALVHQDRLDPTSLVRIAHWTWDGSSADWALPNATSSNSGAPFDESPIVPGPVGPTMEVQLRLSCNSPAADSFACFFGSALGSGFLSGLSASGAAWNKSAGLAWGTARDFGREVGSQVTSPSCVPTRATATSPARNDCFVGDNLDPGLGFGWLYWVPDDNSRALSVAMTERFNLLDPPECIGWGAGEFDCFFADKQLNPLGQATSATADATIWHVLSYGMDHRTLLLESLDPPNDRSVGFWQESLGVAAPTMMQLVENTILGHSVHALVANPRLLTSFACFQGAKFQSLCVAGFVDSKWNSLSLSPGNNVAAYLASRQLVFKLVGNPNGVPPQAPTATFVGKPEGIPKPVR